MPYRGGAMKFFQRAETATFFGREIGLMYTHISTGGRWPALRQRRSASRTLKASMRGGSPTALEP